MSMLDVMNHVQKPVVGERYTVNSLELRSVDDKFNPGQRRDVLVMHTDKGAIYATGPMAKAAVEALHDAAPCPVGKTVIAAEY